MHHVYVLLSSKDNKFYTGYSMNLNRRIQEHNQGKVRCTNGRRPLKLIFYESFINKMDALRRERYLKSSKGRKMLRQLLRRTLNENL